MRKHSVLLHRDAVDVAVGTHAKQMRKEVRRSLMPLFFHLHDEDHSVAQVGISKHLECASVGAQPPESPGRAQSPSLPAAAELAAAEKAGRGSSYPCPA